MSSLSPVGQPIHDYVIQVYDRERHKLFLLYIKVKEIAMI